jgi:hypothetical protein
MPAPAKRAGRGPCPYCAEPVTFKVSAGGLLNFKCDACQGSGYAEQGGTTYRAWQKGIKPFESADPAPADPPAKPEPAPAPKPRRGGFELGQLGGS